MLVLFETAAGYAIFKLLDEKKLSEIDNLYKDFETPDKASEIVKLKMFKKFEDTTEALAAATAAIECKMSKSLKTIMKKVASTELQEELAVADAKVGNMIQEKFDITCVCSPAIHELMRGIRTQMNSLITGLTTKETTAMSLGLAHSLSRYKLKFSPDKVDTMIVQAISLLDDLDKELNNYSMRCREWYGWHFPEIGKIVTDNLAYAKTVKTVGFKTKFAETDLSSILPEDVEEEVKAAAEISMGTEVSEEDIANVSYLCEQIIQISEYRMTLYDYLKNRMQAIAPNLAVLVGELVGARLIAHAGSLLNLAKHPASTIQILGAEKALFRALKTKHDTPKYGLIYHASVVGQTSAKSKGKISRMLGAKSALAARYDALGEDVSTEMGIKHRAAVEARIRFLEEGGMTRISGTGKSASKQQKYEVKSEDISVYNTSMDTTIGKKRKAMEEGSDDDKEDVKPKKVKLEKVELKVEEEETTEQTPKKKKKKKSVVKEELVEEESQEEKTKKMKVEATEEVVDVPEVTEEEVAEEKPKKKKKKDKKKETEPMEVGAEEIEEEATEVATELTDSTEVTEEKTKKKKKGKKRHSEADVEEKMEEEVIEVSSEVSEEATEEKPKKKKKERKSHSEEDAKEKVEEEVTEVSSEVTEELPIKKKKKDKKKKVETVEEAEQVEALESVEPATIGEEAVEEGEKKKKKKKKSKSEV